MIHNLFNMLLNSVHIFLQIIVSAGLQGFPPPPPLSQHSSCLSGIIDKLIVFPTKEKHKDYLCVFSFGFPAPDKMPGLEKMNSMIIRQMQLKRTMETKERDSVIKKSFGDFPGGPVVRTTGAFTAISSCKLPGAAKHK